MASRPSTGFDPGYAGLVEDVLAHPDDDAPRLVLADALMERGDPRGELIAIQCARSEEDDAVDRVAALLDAHGDRWTAGLGPKTLSFGFHRGFVEEVRGPSEVLSRYLPKLQRVAPIRRVLLEKIDHRSVDALLTALVDVGVRSLALAVPPPSEFAAAFRRSTLSQTLEELSIVWASEKLLERPMPRLRTLRTVSYDHDGTQERAVLGLDAPLEHLILESHSSHVLSRLPESPLGRTLRRLEVPRASLGALAKLRFANLAAVDVGQLAPIDEKELAAFERAEVPVRSLGALGAVRPAMLPRLLSAPSMAGVEVLELSYCDLGGAGISALSRAQLSLSDLRLRFASEGTGAPLSSHDVATLVSAPFASRLRLLDLDGNRFGDEGAIAIASRGLNELRVLHLRDAGIGAAGAGAIADSASLPRLRELDLSENDIGEDGALALSNATGLQRLARLQLHFVRVGVRAGRALKARFGGALEKSMS